MLVHAHIPKTGGTSINYLLKGIYGLNFFQLPAPVGIPGESDRTVNLENSICLPNNRGPGDIKKCVSSHYLLVQDNDNDKSIFCYRDPIKRLVSDLSHKAELRGGIPDLDEFMSKRVNLQWTYAVGKRSFEDFKRLVSDGKVVAIKTEAMDSDLAMLGVRGSLRKNVGRGNRFKIDCQRMVENNILSIDLEKEFELVAYLDSYRHEGYSLKLEPAAYYRYLIAELLRKSPFPRTPY